jgi:hypothetical protein
LGQAGLDFLAGHLLGQADELGTRGLPVDGTATDLVG